MVFSLRKILYYLIINNYVQLIQSAQKYSFSIGPENVQIDHHYAQCITEPFEQHLDKS
jgi:hypothetical protein